MAASRGQQGHEQRLAWPRADCLRGHHGQEQRPSCQRAEATTAANRGQHGHEQRPTWPRAEATVLRPEQAAIGVKVSDGLVPRAHPVEHQAEDPLHLLGVQPAFPDNCTDLADGIEHRLVTVELGPLDQGLLHILVAQRVGVDVESVLDKRGGDRLLALSGFELVLRKELRPVRRRRLGAGQLPVLFSQ